MCVISASVRLTIMGFFFSYNNFIGVLIDFISIPVTVGFTSATSVIIVASQLKGLLGLKISSQGFLDTLAKVFRNIGDASPWDAGMSFSCIAVLLFFRVISTFYVHA